MNRTPASANRRASNALPRKAIGRQPWADAVELANRFRLGAQIEHVGNFILHPKGQLERFNRPFDLRMKNIALQFVLVELAHQIELLALEIASEQFVTNILERRTWLFVLAEQGGVKAGDLIAADLGSLTDRGQKAAAIVAGAAVIGRRIDGDKPRQLLVFRAQTV
jgi:hypothetical protein